MLIETNVVNNDSYDTDSRAVILFIELLHIHFIALHEFYIKNNAECLESDN